MINIHILIIIYNKNNEFYIEDLKEEEKAQVLQNAKKYYDNPAEIENKTPSKSKWARLSKIAKAMIILPCVSIGLAIIFTIITNVLPTNSSIGLSFLFAPVLIILVLGTLTFEGIGFAILMSRKQKRDLVDLIKEQKIDK